jgi:hypothetical protein
VIPLMYASNVYCLTAFYCVCFCICMIVVGVLFIMFWARSVLYLVRVLRLCVSQCIVRCGGVAGLLNTTHLNSVIRLTRSSELKFSVNRIPDIPTMRPPACEKILFSMFYFYIGFNVFSVHLKTDNFVDIKIY